MFSITFISQNIPFLRIQFRHQTLKKKEIYVINVAFMFVVNVNIFIDNNKRRQSFEFLSLLNSIASNLAGLYSIYNNI